MSLRDGNESPEIDVIIVGAGLSGLTSAIKISAKEKALQIKIIEASSQPGGLLKSTELGEAGAKFITPDQENILRFMNLLHVSPSRRLNQTSRMKRYWDLDYGLTSIFARFELKRYINMLEICMKNFRPGRFSLQRCTLTMQRHIQKYLFFNKSRNFMKNLVELACGLEASYVKYDQFMSTCSSCGGLQTIMDLYLNVPNSVYELSSERLLEVIMDRIKYIEVINNRKIVEVRQYRNYVEIVDSSGATYMTFSLILAIPWNKVQEINFVPPIPKEFQSATYAIKGSKRVVTTFTAYYQQCWWALAGYSGNFLCNQPFICGQESRPTTFSGIMIHEVGKEESVRETVLEALSKPFGMGMLHPLGYEQFTYELSEAINVPQTTPWHRVIWSSSAAVATYYRNTLGGAVNSGIRAAINALFLVRPQAVGWRDLMDLEYKDPYKNENTGWFYSTFSRFNLYNVVYYGVFVAIVIGLLNRGYEYTKA